MWLLIIGSAFVAAARVCDVTDFGAQPAPYNSTGAVAKAINACCEDSNDSSSNSTIIVPDGVFLSGPQQILKCAGIVLQIDGQLQAPSKIDDWPSINVPQYLHIADSPGVLVHGNGIINGSGSAWWDIRRKTPSHPAPYLLHAESSDGASVRDLHFVDSPKFHVVLGSSSNVLIDGISVTAPHNSPNTDAIDLGSISGATVQNCNISNGDDGVAIKKFTTNVLVQNCTFYGGHGTSIGSLGEDSDGDYVSDITFRNITFHGSDYGTRVKTWQGRTGYVRNITFQDVVLDRVKEAIRINQYYCPASQHPDKCRNSTSKGLNITDVVFRRLSGTQTSGYAGQLLCSDPAPCHGIVLDDVHISSASDGDDNKFQCWQVHGTETDVSPDATGCMWSSQGAGVD